MNNKWFAIFVVIFLILIGSTIYLGFQKYTTGDIKIREKIVADTVWELQSEGYKEDDILSIGVEYHWLKDQAYETAVIFKDEPNVQYHYFRNRDNEIEKGGHTGNAKLHIE